MTPRRCREARENIDHVTPAQFKAGQVSVKMDAVSGSTYKSLGRFENIEIRAEL